MAGYADAEGVRALMRGPELGAEAVEDKDEENGYQEV